MLKKCKLCNKEFEPKFNWTQYCSPECRRIVKNHRELFEIGICTVCNQPSRFSKKDKERICSNECRANKHKIIIEQAIARNLGKSKK